MKSARNLNGYRVIYKPDHHRAMTNKSWLGYVYEHIVVAEDSLGRSLRDNEVVHHLNGIRNDNQSGNLLVLEKSQHCRLHMWLDNGAPYEGTLRVNALNLGKPKSDEPQVSGRSTPRMGPRPCAVCGRTIQASNNKSHCSNECRAITRRTVDRPTKEELELDISNLSWVAMGRKYGVSDNAVRKWARSYGLIG